MTSKQNWLRLLWPYIARYKGRFALALLMSVVGQVMVGLLPLIQKEVVDDTMSGHPRHSVMPWLILLVGLGAAAFVLHCARRSWSARVSLNVQHDLRMAIYRHVNGLDLVRHSTLSVGDLMSRAAGDLTLIQMFINQVPMMVANLTSLVVGVVAMLVVSPLLTAVFLAFVPLFLFLAVRFRGKVFPSSWNDQRLAGAVAGVVDEAVAGVRVVKAFAQERRELALLVARARDLLRSRLRTARLTSVYSATLQALPALAHVGILLLGGWLALQGRITLGVFLAFCSYLVQLSSPVRLLSGMLATSQHARAGTQRFFEFLSLQPTIQQNENAAVLDRCRGEIAFAGVSFCHGDALTINAVSLRIAAGERVGIVGGSGSGKSTLALLMARFYDPSAGTISVDGQDVRLLQLSSVRKHVTVVFEDSFLFSGSIRDNIAFANPAATDHQVHEAARMAAAHDFITALPQGYNTRVGERGYTLSGGQRQRIALARAALMNPTILILDDATSAIDSRTEEAIFKQFAQHLGQRTTVFIAHRPSTLRLATRILVMEKGQLVAEGSHDELLRTSTLYKQLLEGTDAAETPGASPDIRDDIEIGAWPSDVESEGNQRVASVGASIDMVAAKATTGGGGGGGGGNRDFGGGRAAFVQATPELLAQVSSLPPLRDEPKLGIASVGDETGEVSLRGIVRPFRGALWLGLGLVTLDALLGLCGPWLTGRAVDSGVVNRDVYALTWLCAAFLIVQLFAWANARAMQMQTARTAENLLYGLRLRSFAHLQRLSLDFYDRESTGRIMTRMTTDVEAFAQLLQQGLLTAVVSVLGCAGVMAALFVMNTTLALGAFAGLPLLLLGTIVFQRLSGAAYLQARERVALVYADLAESISGIRVTQSFLRESFNTNRFRVLSERYRDARFRSMQLIAYYFPFLQFMSVAAKAVVLGLGAHLFGAGRLSQGVIIAFLLYLDQFFTPLQQLSNVFDQWIQARVSLSRIRELLATTSTTPDLPRVQKLGRLRGELEFRNVRFAYRNGPEALRGIDLHIHPGQVVALVGTTGAGKSTFVKLAARFYDATAGQVLVDGIDIRDLPLTAFRRQLGYVPQEAFLFSGSVRSNIAYGCPDASDLDVERAARAVGAHKFIRDLPSGYRTPVTQRGQSLSAGQRQLLCLARAELVNPAILILDEATSNLDLATEAEVRKAMRMLSRGRTTLLIAHRLQTARPADRIVVLEEGMVVEQGPHDELLRLGGKYAGLWDAFVHSSGGPSLGVAETLKSRPAAVALRA